MSKLFAAIGLVGVLIGLLVGFGVGPLAVTCTSGCGQGVTVNFNVATNDLSATVTDASSFSATSWCTPDNGPHGPNVPTVYEIAVSFGDASNPLIEYSFGFTASHSYLDYGNYTMGETVEWFCSDYPSQFYTTTGISQFTLQSSGGGGGGGGGGGNQTKGSVSVMFSATNVAHTDLVNVKDKSTVSGAAVITNIQVFWGDGANTAEPSVGFTAAHTYAKTGTWQVEETAYWTVNAGKTQTSSYTQQVQVGVGGNSGYGSVNASFKTSSSAHTLTLKDTSVPSSSPAPNVSGVQIAWGDGLTASEPALGFTLNHTYSTGGSFTIAETVSWVGPAPDTSVYQSLVAIQNISCPAGQHLSGGQCVKNSVGTSSANQFWSVFSGLLIVGFGAMFVAALIPVTGKNIPILALATLGGMAAGAVLGFILGHGAVT